jgi:hypothetical protein
MIADRHQIEARNTAFDRMENDVTQQARVKAAIRFLEVNFGRQQGCAVDAQANRRCVHFVDFDAHLTRANVTAPPHGWFAAGIIGEVKAQDALSDLIGHRKLLTDAWIRREQRFPLGFGEPKMIARGFVASADGADGVSKFIFAGAIERARIDIKNQPISWRRSVVCGIERAVFGHLCAGLARSFWQVIPFLQAVAKDFAHYLRTSAGIVVGQKFAVGCETINPLASAATAAFAWALVGHGAEELSFCVAPAPLIPIVGGDGDKFAGGEADDLGV